MADIVLIQPIANRFDKISIRIPNGLLAIAALPDKSGLSVKIIDLKIDNEWRKTLGESMDTNTLCVGINCSTGRMISSALGVAHHAREINPELPIVWGGPHPTLMPEQTLKHPLVDIVVINEGDKVFMELIAALADKKDLSTVQGIGYKRKSIVKINLLAPLIKNIDALPVFPYHLVNVSKYSTLNINNLPSLDILTSRGCPYNCGFCSTPATSQRLWRPLSVGRIIENIIFLKERYGIRTFYFIDDNFMVDLKRVECFLDALKDNNLNIYWGTQGVRVDTINKMSANLLDKIEKSGCVEMSIGVESANQEILDMIDKKIRVEDIYLANEKLAGRRFAVKYNMIIGFPGESLKDIKDTVRLAIELQKRNKNAWFPFNIFTPFPGTPMFQKAIEYGFRAPEDLEGWVRLESVGWSKYYSHWMSEKENALLKSINFTSYVAFPLARQKISNHLLRTLFFIYQPFAYYRFKHMFYFMHFEKYIMAERV